MTPGAHTEAAFEDLIEGHLVEQGGYLRREAADFDAERALIVDDLVGFIEETQSKAWEKLSGTLGARLVPTLLDALDKAADKWGLLHVLRRGLEFYGARLRLVQFRPAHGRNPEIEAAYRANRVAVARQVHHDPRRPGDSLDLVLFVNGLPVVTAELKNAMTSQSAAHAMRQYREDRDPEAPIFRFKRRALVNFAVGSDEVWMTTRLARGKTYFLPFNRGHNGGKGNPPIEGKQRVAYLWEEVWQRDSLLELLARYLHLEKKPVEDADGKERIKETLIFPRYHQLDCVRRVCADVSEKGVGKNYLIQHSAGSGKSNSIAWLAHRLAFLHRSDAEGREEKLFDSVVVITDRTVLDSQLQDTIYQFDHSPGVVRKIDEDSSQLAEALSQGVPIIITTIHKFGFIHDKVEELPGKRFAILVDEAHGSQTGERARNLKEILGASSIAAKLDEELQGEDAVDDPEQAVLRAALSRGSQANLSYFAFTATPKYKTLELFGSRGTDGKPRPFHLYTMRQAIEEEFILDVLKGYTTYKRYYKLVKQLEDDPELDKGKAARALTRFVSLHPTNIAQKTEVILEHFRATVRPKLGGLAKAMVVTESRLHAARYKLAFDRYIAERGWTDVGALVAFSGEVVDPDDPSTRERPHTEPQLNAARNGGEPLPEKRLRKAFAEPGHNVLIVANKYQTGFDQPLLVAMYVDRRLSGIQAVQTLSRLNRTAPGKRTTFVLDFQNEREEILESFQDYYESTTTAEEVDPQRLYELSGDLDAARVWEEAELDRFARVFFKNRATQSPEDHARLESAMAPAVDRFGALDEEAREAFRGGLQAYCNLYSFLGQIVKFHDARLEKRFVFGTMLLRRLPREGDSSGPVNLGEDVALEYYRLEQQADGDLDLQAGEVRELPGPTETGTADPEPTVDRLSHLIDLVNERFGTEFTEGDRTLFDAVAEDLLSDASVRQSAEANDRVNFGFVGERALQDAFVARHERNGGIVDRIFSDDRLLRFVGEQILDDVYRKLREGLR